MRCASLLPFIIGDHETLRPDPQTGAAVNAALAASRGKPAASRWNALLQRLVFEQDGDVLAAGDPKPHWKGYPRSLWAARREWDSDRAKMRWPDDPPALPNEFETPSGGRLTRARWGWKLDGERLPGPLPMADLAEMLSSKDDSVAARFDDWDEMLRTLAACCWRIEGEPSISWVTRSSEPLVPLPGRFAPDAEEWEAEEMLEQLHNNGHHPFWHWAESLSERDVMAQLMQCQISSSTWDELSDHLHDVTGAWQTAIARGWADLHGQSSCPNLLVRDGHLHLLVRSETGFTAERVPADPDVWRFLLTVSLYPPDTPAGHLLRAIIWHWNMACGEIQPLAAQSRALAFLKSVWNTSEADFEFIEPDGIAIRASSGLAYRLRLTGRPGNADIKVWAHPDFECACQNRLGVFICIQVLEHDGTLPLGDRLAAYMLSLREDRKSAPEISTLRMLLESWDARRVKDRKQWEQMLAERSHGFVEGDYDDEDWCIEDELDPHDITHCEEPPEVTSQEMIQRVAEVARQAVANNAIPEPAGGLSEESWQRIASEYGERMR